MPLHESTSQIHLGRLTEDGRRSPCDLMAQLVLANDRSKLEALDSVSRRHPLLVQDGRNRLRYEILA